jgi:hypothetical protein
MREPSKIIRPNIQLYRRLLEDDSGTEIRSVAMKLFAEAEWQLPLAEAKELEREGQAAFSATRCQPEPPFSGGWVREINSSSHCGPDDRQFEK